MKELEDELPELYISKFGEDEADLEEILQEELEEEERLVRRASRRFASAKPNRKR